MKKKSVSLVKNGPLVVENLEGIHESVGTEVKTKEVIALCRCGQSKTKPYCDGSHGNITFSDEKEKDRVPRKVDHYVGKNIIIHDDRGICSHAGFCTDGLPNVFRMQTEPWIDPDAETVEKIIEIIQQCPSGALSYTVNGIHYDHFHDQPQIKITEDGPYAVSGSISLDTQDLPASAEHYTLCRCGSSKNKPYCSGQHWYEKFKDDGKIKSDSDCTCQNPENYDNKVALIKNLAKTGKSKSESMRTEKEFPGFETILFKSAQIATMPLEPEIQVSTETVIGPGSQKPLRIKMPFYVSHMSYGAISKEAKIALAKGSSQVGTAMCSGEGGLLPESREASQYYIYELGTAEFSHDPRAIESADAVEIKIGQSAKPGIAGVFPADKVTPEIAKIRGTKAGEDVFQPARLAGVNSIDDLINKVAWVRSICHGKPVGIKFAAGHIEQDLKAVLMASPDFITIDCRGGGTGSAPVFIKDNVCIPAIYAISRARRYLDKNKSKITLCVTGGFRDSSDIAKAIALGADAVALATASLISIGCQQSKICHTGKCPVGIATQDEILRRVFSIKDGVNGFINFFQATNQELMTFARATGKSDIHHLNLDDIMTTSHDVAYYTDIKHV